MGLPLADAKHSRLTTYYDWNGDDEQEMNRFLSTLTTYDVDPANTWLPIGRENTGNRDIGPGIIGRQVAFLNPTSRLHSNFSSSLPQSV
jgi:hypothetical protein